MRQGPAGTAAVAASMALAASLHAPRARCGGGARAPRGPAVDVRLVLTPRTAPAAAGRPPSRRLRAEVVAPALQLRREVFDAPEPVACAGTADNLSGELTFDCFADLASAQGRLFVDGADLVLELADTYAHTVATARYPLPANARVRFFGARRGLGLPPAQ